MYYFIKRFIDIILSLTAILILFPVLLIIAIILFFSGEGEVLYLQDRIGYKNRPFKIWKFVTMQKNSSNMGTGSITLRNDTRVLPVGRFLRKTKINEIPQLFNILLGTMSIVGARPLMKIDFIKFSPDIQSFIYSTRPGLTGISSIIFRDEERLLSEATLPPQEYYAKYISPFKGELELWYQTHLSLYTDLMIVFLTAWVILFPNSNLVYLVFRNLPKRPIELS